MHERELLIDLAKSVQGKTTVSLDTNVRLALWKDIGELRQLIEQFAGLIDLLFVTDSDDEALFGQRSPESAITGYHAMGYELVVFRRGSLGCVIGDARGVYHIPALAAKALDSTGAGDAFNAGFIRAYITGNALKECALQANAIASCVLGVRGGLNDEFNRTMADTAISNLRSIVNAA